MELNKSEFREVENLFKDFRHHISIKGVIDGYVEGRIFADINRLSAVAVTPEGIFLSDGLKNEAFSREMNTVIKADILPKYEEEDALDYVVFYSPNNNCENQLNIMFDGLNPMKSKRMTFSNDMLNVETVLSEGIYSLDKELFTKTELLGLDWVIDEILDGWVSVDDFLSRGFGCVAIVNDKIIGWCLTDWVVGDECEIGIETHPKYQKQGFGRKMANATLALAKNMGMKRTGWQCWTDNAGSIATAKSVGFKLLKEFEVFFGWANKLNNMLINGNYYMFGKTNLNIGPADFKRSAWSYSQALDKGWDWDGDPSLYWNCACMFYKSGEIKQAKHYYRLAIEKGWHGIEPHVNNPHVYTEHDSKEILICLTEV
ncbi:MAG: GNAT family N-acetyltransferase [Clostridium sp.]|uniref:GNAT family N-acetyltransferase n=1 Tax=Clostridium sp. TaxID=1506 RepID=UPI003D6D5DFB